MRKEDLSLGTCLILKRIESHGPCSRKSWTFYLYALRVYLDFSFLLLAFSCMVQILFARKMVTLDYLLTGGTLVCVGADMPKLVVLWLPVMLHQIIGLSGWKPVTVAFLWIAAVTWFVRKDVSQVREFLQYEEATGRRPPVFFQDQIASGQLKPEDVEPDLCRAGPSAQTRLMELWLDNPGIRPAIRRLHGNKKKVQAL